MSMGQQPAPGWAPPQPQPKKNTAGKIIGFGCLGLVGLFVVLIAIVAVAGSKTKPSISTPATNPAPAASRPLPPAASNVDPDKAADIKIDDCSVDEVGFAKATLTITNHSSKQSNYMVQVDFVGSNGVRIGQGMAATNNLDPGAVAQETAVGTGDVKDGKVTCKVSDVTRYASN